MNNSITSNDDDAHVSQFHAYRNFYFPILFYDIFYDYFHIDRDLRRRQYLRYRQRVYEKSSYHVGKKDFSHSRKLVHSLLEFKYKFSLF